MIEPDYVRTYTWDKVLESWVRETAFLGGAGKGEDTIITPSQYRHRFLTAMERYFPLVCDLVSASGKRLGTKRYVQTPDRWMKQRDVPEEYDVDW